MFIQFLISSGKKKVNYDPIGRYNGVFYLIIIGITILFNHPVLNSTLTLIIIIFTIISLISRYYFIYKARNII